MDFEALRAQVEEAARVVNAALSAEIEVKVSEAHALGLDLAVSDLVGGVDDCRAWFIMLEPGARPPLGKNWTVYPCGARSNVADHAHSEMSPLMHTGAADS